MSKEQEPIPCPWCTGQHIILCHSYATSNPYHWEQCGDCGASGPGAETEAEAIAAWNRRAPSLPWIRTADALPDEGRCLAFWSVTDGVAYAGSLECGEFVPDGWYSDRRCSPDGVSHWFYLTPPTE